VRKGAVPGGDVWGSGTCQEGSGEEGLEVEERTRFGAMGAGMADEEDFHLGMAGAPRVGAEKLFSSLQDNLFFCARSGFPRLSEGRER